MRSRAEIKAEARGLIRTAQASPLLVTTVMLAVGFLLDRIVDLVETGSLFYTYTITTEEIQNILNGNYSALLNTISITPGSTFFSILVSLFNVVLSGGYYVYCMGIRQGREMPCSSLLEGLSVAGRLIWCYILISIKTFLWSLLFFIPGLVAAYRYRFAYFNLLTDSSLSAGDAIRLSCEQTRGMKGGLFALDLSFLGWYILADVIVWFCGPILSILIPVLFGVWLTPYWTLSTLAYFEEGQRRLGRPPCGGAEPPYYL